MMSILLCYHHLLLGAFITLNYVFCSIYEDLMQPITDDSSFLSDRSLDYVLEIYFSSFLFSVCMRPGAS